MSTTKPTASSPAEKRSYRAGSLYKRADTAGTETWYGRWWSGKKQFKRRLGPVRAKGVGLTEKQAETQLGKMMEETPKAPAPSSESLCIEELGERYARELEKRKRKRSTVVAVQSALRVRIVPFFGDESLDSYKDSDVEGFVAWLEGDELSGKTIRNYVGILSAMFKYAIAAETQMGVEKPL